jgi:hypothetical protein
MSVRMMRMTNKIVGILLVCVVNLGFSPIKF